MFVMIQIQIFIYLTLQENISNFEKHLALYHVKLCRICNLICDNKLSATAFHALKRRFNVVSLVYLPFHSVFGSMDQPFQMIIIIDIQKKV